MSSTATELETLNDLLKKFRFAMVTTRAEDGALHAHPLTVQEKESDGDLWFIVGTHASAVEHVRRDPKVGLSFSTDGTWLSLAGEAEVVDDLAKLKDCGRRASRRGSRRPRVARGDPAEGLDPHRRVLGERRRAPRHGHRTRHLEGDRRPAPRR